MSPPTILDLANTIQAKVAAIHNAQTSSATAPDGESPELAQLAALGALDELRAQLMGPVQYPIYCSAWWVSTLPCPMGPSHNHELFPISSSHADILSRTVRRAP